MKIKIIEPVIETINTIGYEGEDEYLRKNLAKSTKFDRTFIEHGFESVESSTEQQFCIPDIILETIKAEDEGYDAVYVNCFADPGVYPGRESVKVPVFGAFIPTMLIASASGEKISIIATSKNYSRNLEKQVKDSEFKDKVVSIRYTNLTVLELSKREKLLNTVVSEAIKAYEEDDADIVVLGCTAMAYLIEDIKIELKKKGYEISVLEPEATALKFLEMYVQLGLTNSLKNKINTNIEKLVWHTNF
jgi:allantoin racemase